MKNSQNYAGWSCRVGESRLGGAWVSQRGKQEKSPLNLSPPFLQYITPNLSRSSATAAFHPLSLAKSRREAEQGLSRPRIPKPCFYHTLYVFSRQLRLELEAQASSKRFSFCNVIRKDIHRWGYHTFANSKLSHSYGRMMYCIIFPLIFTTAYKPPP